MMLDIAKQLLGYLMQSQLGETKKYLEWVQERFDTIIATVTDPVQQQAEIAVLMAGVKDVLGMKGENNVS